MSHFFRLGHQHELSLYEYTLKTGTEPEIHSRRWLIGEPVDIQSCGSIVFGGEILASKENTERSDIFQALPAMMSEFAGEKKIGLWIESIQMTSRIMEIAKKEGFKVVTAVAGKEKFTYGHWKKCKNWIVGFYIDETFYFGKITQMVDQQFWGDLDQKLEGSMKRGLMNLKLSRTLLSFTQKKYIWDPFGGVGRTAVSGWDLQKKFYISDIDEECENSVEKNSTIGDNQWYKDSRKKHISTEFSSIEKIFTGDARKLEDLWNEHFIGINPNEVAIVTEGWLGHNFTQTPTVVEAKKQRTLVFKIVEQVLQEAEQIGIPEIIICIPAFRKINNSLPESIGAYSIVWDTIYSRKTSFVGHHILHLKLSK